MPKKKKSKISMTGWVYSLRTLSILPDEEGRLGINLAFVSRKKLRERMGNEWGRLAKKVRITIEEID